jgi:uncharacterized small protein (DUF1192 family)
MNEYSYAIEKQRNAMAAHGVQAIDENPTVQENIDRKIALLRREIDRLEQSKTDLNPLLQMRIRDIRQAMDY